MIDPAAVIDIVASLVDKSLVTATGEREVRYRLLETVRAYAGDRLAEAGEAGQTGAAHARYFVALAERAEPELRARDQAAWMIRLTAEHDNCIAALRHALEVADVATALRFVRALGWFWIMRDYQAEAAQWAGAAADLAARAPPAGLEDAYALCELFRVLTGLRPGRPDLNQLVEVMGQIETMAAGSTHPMLIMAGVIVAVLCGDLDGARRILARLSGHPDPWLTAAGLVFGGYLDVNEGEIDAAGQGMAAGYAAFREIGDRWAMSVCLNGQAQVAMARDDAGAAVRLLEEAREYASASGLAVNWGEMMSIPLGHARAVSGDLAGARADLERGVGFAGRAGEHDDEASGYIELSEVARRSGDLAAARELIEQALEIVTPRFDRMEMHGVAARTAPPSKPADRRRPSSAPACT